MRKKFVFRQKIVKISEIQQSKLDELMDSGSFTSEADIWRQGLDLLHRKLMPPYLKPSTLEEARLAKKRKEQEYLAIPDEEIASKIDGIFIYTDDDQKKWFLYRKFGNFIGALPLSEIKTWAVDDNPEYRFHVEAVATRDFIPFEKDLIYNETRRDLANKGVKIDYQKGGGIYGQ